MRNLARTFASLRGQAIFLILLSLASSPGLQAAEKIMIGVSNPNMTFLPARIAVKKGFFGEEGLEAEVIRMRVKVFSPDGSIPLDGLRLVIEQAKREAGITRDIPFSEVADLTFVREAQRELGLKVR